MLELSLRFDKPSPENHPSTTTLLTSTPKVIEYLAKKGYTKTEAALRREERELLDGKRLNVSRAEADPASKYDRAFGQLSSALV